ncbi:hypothetical protein FRC10_005657, partial [Ceratobasidium sp. 414]
SMKMLEITFVLPSDIIHQPEAEAEPTTSEQEDFFREGGPSEMFNDREEPNVFNADWVQSGRFFML